MPTLSSNLVWVVAAALINPRGEILIAQRPAHKNMGGLWEFAGGKIEAGESPEAALMRELQEELGIEVAAENLQPLTFVSHDYSSVGDPSPNPTANAASPCSVGSAKFKPFHLLMLCYTVRKWSGTPSAKEHSALAWVTPDKLSDYPMPPADIPLISALQSFAFKAV